MVLTRIFLLLSVLLAPTVAGFAAVAAAETASEQAVRAALVFNFIKFTEWPATATSHPQLRICIAATQQAQVAALEALGARQIRGTPLAVARYQRQADCNVIYVDSRQRWNEVAEQYAAGHALTIGGYAGFVADGGMIEIALQETTTRFDINLFETKRAALRIYPQLLRLARHIME